MTTPAPTTFQRFDRSIVEGPIGPAVWRLAWPTMLQNVIAGLQGIIDHAMTIDGYAVGYTELFSLVTWTSVGLMGASATIAGQNLGASNPERAMHGVAVASRIGHFTRAALSVVRFRQGRWRHIRADIEPARS